MPDYSLLVFDWDGTLVDSVDRIVESMRVAAERSGLSWRSDEAIKGIIGLGLPEAIQTLYPEVDDEAALAIFRSDYAEHYLLLEVEPSPLFPGVAEALEYFRRAGYRLAVATGKNRRGLDRVLKGRGWEDFFDITRAADETASKPDPRMLNEILAHCEVPARRALMVGDAPFDLEMARRAGMDSVAVSYGAQPLSVLRQYRPRLEIGHFNELRAWLDGQAQNPRIEVSEHVG